MLSVAAGEATSQSSTPGTFSFVDQTSTSGAVNPLTLNARAVLQVSVPRRRGSGQARRRAAASWHCDTIAQFLAGRGGAERALQGGRAARAGWRAEQHPATVLHQLRQTGQEVCVASAAGAYSQPPSSTGDNT